MQVWGMIWSEQRDGSPHAETFVKLPKRIQIAVWDDSYHSQIMRFWIPAFAGMTVLQRSPFVRTREGGLLRRRDSSTLLRFARNDM